LAGVATVLVGIITGFIMVGISFGHFKGVTGDVLGATNELARMVSLITLLAIV
jgi:adenosylcobinamide-GDP ribazoletransferase